MGEQTLHYIRDQMGPCHNETPITVYGLPTYWPYDAIIPCDRRPLTNSSLSKDFLNSPRCCFWNKYPKISKVNISNFEQL